MSPRLSGKLAYSKLSCPVSVPNLIMSSVEYNRKDYNEIICIRIYVTKSLISSAFFSFKTI